MTLPGAQHGCDVFFESNLKAAEFEKRFAVMFKRPLRWIVTSETRIKIDNHFDKNEKQFVRRHETDRSTLSHKRKFESKI